MMPSKRLVIFCDGTWVGRETKIEGAPPSNIRLLANMAGRVQEPEQPGKEPTTVHPIQTINPSVVAGYQEGVGLNQTFLEYVWNAATGSTIGEECVSVYRFIVEHFTDEHEIWMFGFSRGAFTVRCVAGMINNCGIIKRDAIRSDQDVGTLCHEVYRTYRSPLPIDHPASQRCKDLRASPHIHQIDQPIPFMGLIDTVGSLGIPSLDAGIGFSWPETEFHDQTCSSVVKSVYHAAALHDRLWAFQPCLIYPDKAGRTQVKQTWFPGCHYDLGRQTFRFLRQRPWNVVERWLGVLPNLLSKTVRPNEVLADVVLRWLLQAVWEEEESDKRCLIFPYLSYEIPRLDQRIATPQPGTLGSDDVYNNVFTTVLPFSYVTEPLKRLLSLPFKFLNFLFPRFGDNIYDLTGIKFISSIITATRDRRIARAHMQGTDHDIEQGIPEVYPYKNEESAVNAQGVTLRFTVQERAEMRDVDVNEDGTARYPSRAYETFSLRKGIFGW